MAISVMYELWNWLVFRNTHFMSLIQLSYLSIGLSSKSLVVDYFLMVGITANGLGIA